MNSPARLDAVRDNYGHGEKTIEMSAMAKSAWNIELGHGRWGSPTRKAIWVPQTDEKKLYRVNRRSSVLHRDRSCLDAATLAII